MKFSFTIEYKVKRISWIKYDRENPRGSGYCADQGEHQILYKLYKFKGFTIWMKEIDREDVPSFASIETNIFGRTDWKSKFAEYIK